MNAKDFIATQIAAIQRGDLAAVKAGLTERHRDKITAEMIDKARQELAAVTLDDLVDSTDETTAGSIKVKMKNDRTLTTLVDVEGVWAADTIWFR